MKFIELTDSELKTPIYVNIESICATYSYCDGTTLIKLNNGTGYWVLEQPEEILEMIENTLNKNNHKH